MAICSLATAMTVSTMMAPPGGAGCTPKAHVRAPSGHGRQKFSAPKRAAELGTRSRWTAPAGPDVVGTFSGGPIGRPFRYRLVGVVAFDAPADSSNSVRRSTPRLWVSAQERSHRRTETSSNQLTIPRAGDKVLPTDGPSWDEVGQRQNDAQGHRHHRAVQQPGSR